MITEYFDLIWIAILGLIATQILGIGLDAKKAIQQAWRDAAPSIEPIAEMPITLIEGESPGQKILAPEICSKLPEQKILTPEICPEEKIYKLCTLDWIAEIEEEEEETPMIDIIAIAKYRKMTLKELKKIGKQKGIKKYYAMKKAELYEHLAFG